VPRVVPLMLVAALSISTYGVGGVTSSSVAGATAPTAFNAGFRAVPLTDTRKMAVWYPTADAESSFQYFRSLGTTLAQAGSPAAGPFPLVAFSHGFGGCGIQSVFFTEEVARRGYVVVAPDHRDALCGVDGTGSLRFIKTDETFSRPERWNESTQIDRKDDLQLAIQWVLDSAEFGRSIDRSSIGLVGHSLGGYTVLGVAGGWTSWKDDRVRAVLVFSPYVAPFLVQQRLASVNVPLMYQGAGRDRLITAAALRGDHGAYGASNPPKYYVQLAGGTHFVWTNLLCFGTRTVSQCLTAKPNAKLINAYGIAFLDGYLKEETQALQRLDGSGLEDYKQKPR
jgi:predicted dienelactone hydrolase